MEWRIHIRWPCIRITSTIADHRYFQLLCNRLQPLLIVIAIQPIMLQWSKVKREVIRHMIFIIEELKSFYKCVRYFEAIIHNRGVSTSHYLLPQCYLLVDLCSPPPCPLLPPDHRLRYQVAPEFRAVPTTQLPPFTTISIGVYQIIMVATSPGCSATP